MDSSISQQRVNGKEEYGNTKQEKTNCSSIGGVYGSSKENKEEVK